MPPFYAGNMFGRSEKVAGVGLDAPCCEVCNALHLRVQLRLRVHTMNNALERSLYEWMSLSLLLEEN